jgi:predicted AlkP superfamily phosphohydrolase/phosphomutase
MLKHGSKHLLVIFLISLIVPVTGASETEKVLVVGLDGADWNVIKPLVDDGEMPNLERLMEDGRYGNLTTTLPIESPVAWTSMTTGTTPGKHGIYGFLEKQGDEFVPTTGENVRKKRVWDYVGEEGEVVVVNVPQTFPPQKVNGSLVSSYLSIEERGYTYPERLQGDLEEINYTTEVLKDGFETGKEQEFLTELNSTVETRTEAANIMLEQRDWKLGFVVYTGLDRLQHYLWNYRDEEGEESSVIKDHYRKLDGEIGELLENTDEDTAVMVVSDHGFGPLAKNVYLNTWLRKEGYLQFESKNKANGVLSNLGLTQQNIVDLLSDIGILDPVQGFFSYIGYNPGEKLPEPKMSDIDFSKSQAYAGNYGGKIYLTENINDSDKLLDELETGLKKIQDPETGKSVFKEVHRAEDIYTGAMENSPDLILEPRDSYRAVGFLGHQEVVKKPPKKSGTHSRDGIYLIKGPEVESGNEDANITDIVPTILEVLDIPKSQDIDGSSLISDKD